MGMRLACRFMEMRAAVPTGELPVYAPREQMRGADVRCYVQASAPPNWLAVSAPQHLSLLLNPPPADAGRTQEHT